MFQLCFPSHGNWKQQTNPVSSPGIAPTEASAAKLENSFPVKYANDALTKLQLLNDYVAWQSATESL